MEFLNSVMNAASTAKNLSPICSRDQLQYGNICCASDLNKLFQGASETDTKTNAETETELSLRPRLHGSQLGSVKT